ncbi:aldose 1-epimerase family protein [Flavobacterium restrictum]|uniref:Aldose 1-epimerase family protein n=1 Tax=Flavobacterium restrictum TaxID=2594428 RepID=A0A553DZX3_9FLAO|nr:aldose 1-epimerase family protein [Flavobacterium restrictum]TRX38339.1 aldose 1-epimerase family protein [Flavobacterium restrictum]
MTTTITNSILTAQINHLGAELFSLKNNQNKEYIWDGNPDFWGKHSPILFPIVGTLNNNSFHYQGVDYHLSRHGFAREMEFTLVEKSATSATFRITSDAETVKKYPFEFELDLIYTLSKNRLIIEYKVSNTSNTAMPFSIGAHPAFALPNAFENYALEFATDESLDYYLLENDLISNTTKTISLHNNQLPLAYELFANDALILKKLNSNAVSILENSKPILKVSFENFPSLGLWTKPNAPFLCIEPWFGYSDTRESNGNLFDKEGIQILEQEATFESRFSIEII